MTLFFFLVKDHYLAEQSCVLVVAKDRMDLFETEDGIEDRLQTVRGNGKVHLDAASNAKMENRDRGKEMRGPTRT